MKKLLMSILLIVFSTQCLFAQSKDKKFLDEMISDTSGRYVFTSRSVSDDNLFSGYLGVLTDSKTGRVWAVGLQGIISLKYHGDADNSEYFPGK